MRQSLVSAAALAVLMASTPPAAAERGSYGWWPEAEAVANPPPAAVAIPPGAPVGALDHGDTVAPPADGLLDTGFRDIAPSGAARSVAGCRPLVDIARGNAWQRSRPWRLDGEVAVAGDCAPDTALPPIPVERTHQGCWHAYVPGEDWVYEYSRLYVTDRGRTWTTASCAPFPGDRRFPVTMRFDGCAALHDIARGTSSGRMRPWYQADGAWVMAGDCLEPSPPVVRPHTEQACPDAPRGVPQSAIVVDMPAPTVIQPCQPRPGARTADGRPVRTEDCEAWVHDIPARLSMATHRYYVVDGVDPSSGEEIRSYITSCVADATRIVEHVVERTGWSHDDAHALSWPVMTQSVVLPSGAGVSGGGLPRSWTERRRTTPVPYRAIGWEIRPTGQVEGLTATAVGCPAWALHDRIARYARIDGSRIALPADPAASLPSPECR